MSRLNIRDQFTLPTGFGTAARDLHVAFQTTRKLTVERRVLAFAKSKNRDRLGLPLIWNPDLNDPEHFAATYAGMVSARQSGVACDGHDFEKLAEYCYGEVLFPQYLESVESQLGFGLGKERDIDLFLNFCTRKVFVNCKATTRERSNIWHGDLEFLYKKFGDTDWKLLCLFAEFDMDCSLDESLREVGRMRAYIEQRITNKAALDHLLIVCAQDVAGHEACLRQIAP
jgi:hypothetical protein